MKTRLLAPLALCAAVAVGWGALRSGATAEPAFAVDWNAPRPDATPESAAAMTDAANRFLASLSAEQRANSAFPFDAEERTRWHFIPDESHRRRGVTFKEMSRAQRDLAHALLRSGLSQSGYRTATAVLELEGILRDMEGPNRRIARDPEQYHFSVFGTPANTGSWGWRVEGHHLSLHFTVVNGRWVATAPAFLGANPAEVRDGPRKGLRILAEREDVARQLALSLDAGQRATAVIATDAPSDILTGNRLAVEPLSPVGIPASALRPDQRALLMDLIDVYASLMADDLAEARMAALREAGTGGITFAWAGGTRRGDRHYYRVQGPTFLVEYDNTQNNANHIHSVWRDFQGDFGRDLLREHLAAVPHR